MVTLDVYERPQQLRVWNTADGTLVRAIGLRSHRLREISFAAFTPGSDQVMSLTQPVHPSNQPGQALAMTWSLTQPGPTASFRVHSDEPTTGGGNGACLTPDGKSLVVPCDNTDAARYDLASAKRTAVYHGHNKQVASVAVDDAGHRLLTGSEDGTARLWDLASGRALLTVTSKELGPDPTNDADRFHYSDRDHPSQAIVWDLHTGEKVCQFDAGTEELASIALSPDGKSWWPSAARLPAARRLPSQTPTFRSRSDPRPREQVRSPCSSRLRPALAPDRGNRPPTAQMWPRPGTVARTPK